MDFDEIRDFITVAFAGTVLGVILTIVFEINLIFSGFAGPHSTPEQIAVHNFWYLTFPCFIIGFTIAGLIACFIACSWFAKHANSVKNAERKRILLKYSVKFLKTVQKVSLMFLTFVLMLLVALEKQSARKSQSSKNWKTFDSGFKPRNNWKTFDGGVNYDTYIRSPEWRRKRNSKLHSVGWRCEICGVNNRQSKLEVHHIIYDTIPHESWNDLLAVCRECHQREHGIIA